MMKKLICIGVPVIAADQAIKAVIRCQTPGQTIFEIPGVVAITPSFNTGAAFSLFSGNAVFLAAISAVLLLSLVFYVGRHMRLTHAAQAALCCLVGGGVGNLIDRVVYAGVTDYIRLLLFDFPVFNLADIAITGSIAVLFILLLAGRLEETTGEKDGSDH